jgi:iron complex outermembrane receptor protein
MRCVKYSLIPLVATMCSPIVMADTDPGSRKLAKVVITGELLSRTADETGSSVLLLEEEALNRRQDIRTVRDVLREIPNVTDVTGTGKAPTVRGVDGTGPAENANAFFAGSRQRLNWQIDGRSASYNEVVFGDLGIWDLHSIEVFRGPQSTLVGRNAIAGTILVETNDPTVEREGAVRIEGGNFDQKRLSLMYNQPINDSVSFRLAADGIERQSSVDYDNVEGVGNPADIQGHTLRGKLLYEPKDDRATRFVLTVSDVNYEGPNGEIVVRPFEDRRSNFPLQPVHNPHSTSAGIEFSSFLTDSLELQLDAAITDFTFKRKTDAAGSRAEVNTDEYVLEPRLRYTSDSGNEWVVGTRLYQSRQDEWINFIGIQRFEDEADAYSLYGEGLIPLGGSYELTLGLRYEEENRTRHGGDPTGQIATIHADNSYDALLPKLGLSYKPNDDQTVGILYSRGFNSGGGGITFSFPIVNYQYSEEYVDSFELYGRQQWLDGRLSTTQNLFYSLYEDMQLPFDLTPTDSRDEAFVVRNAGEVRIQGLELGMTWQVDQRWKLFGNLALLDTEITDYPNSGIEGNSLFTAPPASLQLGASVVVDRWEATLSGQFSDGYYTSITNNPDGKVDAYGALNANISYRVNETIKLYVAARNLLDEESPIALYPGTAPSGSTQPNSDFDTAVLMQPRTLTAGMQFNF